MEKKIQGGAKDSGLPAVTARVSPSLSQEGRAIRQAVFVEEQGYALEFDDKDEIARHAVIFLGGVPAAAGRVYFEKKTAVLGRLAVRKPFRGQGLGRAVVRVLEEDAKKEGARTFRVMA